MPTARRFSNLRGWYLQRDQIGATGHAGPSEKKIRQPAVRASDRS
jgi:hypothetical protein